MAILQDIWWLLVLIGVMILIHEAGHFWAARFFDVRIDTFSFGFGPRLFGFRRGETDFRFSAILFGGYVKMAGEQPGEDGAADPRSFLSKPRWQRLIIAFAGPFMNIVLAVGLLTGLFMVRYPKAPVVHSPIVGAMVANGAAAKAGILEGDRVVQIDNIVNPTWDDIRAKESFSPNRPLNVIVERNNERKFITMTPIADEKNGIGDAAWAEQAEIEVASVEPGMGAEKAGLKAGDELVAINGLPIRSTVKMHEVIRSGEGKPAQITYRRNGKDATVPVIPVIKKVENQEETYMIGVKLQQKFELTSLSFPNAFVESCRQNLRGATMIYKFLQGMLERKMSPKSLEGPIGIAKHAGEAAREGSLSFILLMAAVSLNLAIFNLLPIPILDGGVILLLLVEMLRRRDLSLGVKEAVFKVGFVFLMALVVFVLYNDITKS